MRRGVNPKIAIARVWRDSGRSNHPRPPLVVMVGILRTTDAIRALRAFGCPREARQIEVGLDLLWDEYQRALTVNHANGQMDNR